MFQSQPTYCGQNEERLPAKPVTKPANHRACQELEKGEDGAKEPSKQHRVELGWSTNNFAEHINL